MTSLGIGSGNNNSKITGNAPDFHDERVKDAMTFNNVMKSVHNSTGFLGQKEVTTSLG
jgi:hypothetical protein